MTPHLTLHDSMAGTLRVSSYSFWSQVKHITRSPYDVCVHKNQTTRLAVSSWLVNNYSQLKITLGFMIRG